MSQPSQTQNNKGVTLDKQRENPLTYSNTLFLKVLF